MDPSTVVPGSRRRCAVLGSPVAHSRSPALWRAAFADLGLDWDYDAVECTEEQLPALLASIRADPAWAGLSLTMPLKRAVLPLLDEVRTPAGAVNTVIVEGERLTGHNTDGAGILAAYAELGPPDGARVVVLGAGGTAAAVLAVLADRAEVSVAARRAGSVPAGVVTLPWAPAALAGADVVVNTTPAGAADVLVAGGWPGGGALLDVLYAPWPTALARAAAAAGVPVVGGLSVLVGQAVEAIELVTGARPDPARLHAAAAGTEL